MAKKKTTKKTAVKKPSKKKAVKKKPAKKPAARKAATKKSAAKKPATKKAAVKKTTAKKPRTKKAATKKTTKKTAKKPAAAKKVTKKAPAKKTPTKQKVAAAPPPKPKPVKPEDMTLEQRMEKDWTIPQLKRVKTGMKKKDLDEFLQLLLEKRSEIIGNVQGMESTRDAALADIAHMPLHMADVGSDNFEQEFTLGLMESEREMLREIEEAIIRMREGYYGVCLDSGQPINRARLEIKPWAKYCIEVARIHEKRGW